MDGGWRHATVLDVIMPSKDVSWAWISDDKRSQYLAMRNGADGSKAHCAYCGGPASCLDGKNCPFCGAEEVEIRRQLNATLHL